jgi:guanine nucleotide-binding protein G(I)/G(S)/G(T) subunit beta-1
MSFSPPTSIDGISIEPSSSSLSLLERLRRARDQVAALKERVAGMRKAQENDIDWATSGKGPDPNISFRFEIRRLLRGHFNKVHACAWAGDDTTAASVSQDGKMIIWNTFTRDKLDVIFLESNFAMSCAFESQTDSLVATGGLDNKCSVFAVGEGAVTKMRSVGASYAREPVAELVGHDGYVSDIVFCSGQIGPVGRLLTASGDGTVALWDLNASSSSSSSGESGRRSIVSSLSGRNLLGGGVSKDAKGGSALSVFSDHQADVMCVDVNPMDPNVFATGSCDKTMKIWDIRRPRAVCSFEGHRSDVNTVKFFPNGLSVCTGSDDSSCRVFDLRSCGPILVLSDERQQSGVTDVAVSKSGRLVFASYEESCKQVAGLSETERNKAAIRAAAVALAASGKSSSITTESEDIIKAADSSSKATNSSSSTSDKIVSANLPCHVIAWETISSIGLFHELRGNTKRVSGLSVNSSGQALLAANWDHNLTVWA